MTIIHRWIPLHTVMERRGVDFEQACEKYEGVMKYGSETCMFCANFLHCCKTVSHDHTIGTVQSFCPNTTLIEFLERDKMLKMSVSQ